MDDLLNRLHALGLKFEKTSDIEKKKQAVIHFEDVFKGKWIHANDRKIFVIEKKIAFGDSVNAIVLPEPNLSRNLFQLFRMQKNPWKTKNEFVFLDTETSSLSIGAGSFIFMIGICYFTKTGLVLNQIVLPDIQHEILFLNVLEEKLKDFSTIITYNGKSFDVPIIRSRCLLNGINSKIDKLIHLDLLHLARSLWKPRLDSRKLSDIEKNILGISRTKEEIPGWLVPQMYFDYLESGNSEMLKGVAYHNEMDIISLAILFSKINEFSQGEFSQLENENLLDIFAIGEILRKGKEFDLAGKVFEYGEENRIEELMPAELIRKYGLTLKRLGNLDKSNFYFELAAKKGDIIACVETAKYYEHNLKNFKKAYIYCKKAIELSKTTGKSDKYLSILEHRLNRISEKNGG